MPPRFMNPANPVQAACRARCSGDVLLIAMAAAAGPPAKAGPHWVPGLSAHRGSQNPGSQV